MLTSAFLLRLEKVLLCMATDLQVNIKNSPKKLSDSCLVSSTSVFYQQRHKPLKQESIKGVFL